MDVPSNFADRPSSNFLEEKSIKFLEIVSQEDLSCPISFELMSNAVTLSCGHNFNKAAIDKWFSTNKNKICPLCKYKTSCCIQNIFLQNVVKEWIKKTKPNEDKEEKLFISEEVYEKFNDILSKGEKNNLRQENLIEMLLNLQSQYPNQHAQFAFLLEKFLNEDKKTTSFSSKLIENLKKWSF